MQENDEREQKHRDRIHGKIGEMSEKAQEQFAKVDGSKKQASEQNGSRRSLFRSQLCSAIRRCQTRSDGRAFSRSTANLSRSYAMSSKPNLRTSRRYSNLCVYFVDASPLSKTPRAHNSSNLF